MPKYRHATYAKKSLTLKNKYLRLDIHKRNNGFGWGEIFTSSDKLMGILEHLGEIKIRDMDIPMRFSSNDVKKESLNDLERLTFNVESVVVQKSLKGTSFEKWICYPFEKPFIKGEVIIELSNDAPIISLKYNLVSKANLFAEYIRGPWLKIGEASFGSKKDDAIFPGIEWLIGDEWSSGTDWFKDPWATKYAPHPNKISIPVMALSHENNAIGLAWKPNKPGTKWFNYKNHYPQPVFASPNFIDRKNNHLMGIMLPDAKNETDENKVYASNPLELHLDQKIEFDAEIMISHGGSHQLILDWVKRNGLPEISSKYTNYSSVIKRIASSYNTRFWHENKGFGNLQNPDQINFDIPVFIEKFIKNNPKSKLAKQLNEKVQICKRQGGCLTGSRVLSKFYKKNDKELFDYGMDILKEQLDNGSFKFDPDGKHYLKDDFVVARDLIEPMADNEDTALDICILPTIDLILIFKKTKKQIFKDAAIKALDFCMEFKRPEGGDYWETPLHSPNLLAAGHASVAYYLGYELTNNIEYKEKAIYWIRSLIPFTHLWEPEDKEMLYNTKPCLCSSDWYFANWVRDHVIWEVLDIFALSIELKINWNEIDNQIDWHQYHKGITSAAIRWMLDHKKENWYPHNIPWTYDLYKQGKFDDCFPDTHNSITGNYGGMVIMPDVIASNIYGIINKEERNY